MLQVIVVSQFVVSVCYIKQMSWAADEKIEIHINRCHVKQQCISTMSPFSCFHRHRPVQPC